MLGTTALVAAAFATASPLHAQSYNWTGATNNDYGTATNWSGAGTPPPDTNTESAVFSTGGANTNVNVANPTTVNTWTFNGTTGYAITGATVTFSGSGAGVTNNASVAQSIDNNISGTGSVTQNGTGTLTLNGTNGYSGGTFVQSGTLQLGAAASLGSATATTTVTGGTLNLGGTAQTQQQLILSGTGSVQNGTLNATASVDQSGGTFSATTTTATYNQSAGTMSGTANATTYNHSGGLLSGTANVTTYNLTSATATSTGGVINASSAFNLMPPSGTASVAAQLTGTGTLNKSGAGAVTLTNATNNYTGSTVITAGQLNAAATGTLGANTNSVTVNGGTAVLNLSAVAHTQNGGVVLDGGGTITNGTLSSSGTFDMRSGTAVAILAGSGGVTKTTGGTVTFGGANTYTGSTNITAGTLLLSGIGTLGNVANSTTINGATAVLDLGGTSQTQNGGVNLQNGGTIKNGSLAGAIVSTGGLVNGIGGTATLTANGGVSGLTTLSGTNTYSGATNVNNLAVLLALNPNAFSANSTLNVNAGGVADLGGFVQTINSIKLNGGGATLASGALSGGVIDSAGGNIFNVTGSSNLNANSGTTNLSAGNAFNAGTVGSGATLAATTGSNSSFSSTLINSGAITVANTGVLTVTGGITNNIGATITVSQGGTVNDALNNSGAVTNSGAYNANVANQATGTINNTSTGVWTGNLTSNTNTSATAIQNAGTWIGSASNAGGLTNTGTWTTTAGGFGNSGTLNTSGTINATVGGFVNSGTTNASGILNGVIANIGGTFNATGTLSSNSTFNNSAALNVNTGTYTIAGLVTNSGNLTVANGATLNAAAGITNTVTGVITNNFGGTINDTLNNSGLVNNSGAYNANVNNQVTGTINNNAPGGVWTGNVLSNAGAITNNATWNGNVAANTGFITNNALAVWTGNGNNTTGTLSNTGIWNGTITNAGTFNNNNLGQVSGLLTNTAGTTTNNGALNGGVTAFGGTVTNNSLINGTVAISGAAAVSNNGLINGAVNNAGTLDNNGAGSITGTVTVSSTGTANNNATIIGTVVNAGTFNNTGAGATVSAGLNNSGTATNASGATINGGVTNSGTFTNSAGVANSGGTVNGGLTQTAGTTNNTFGGRINGGANISGGIFNNAASRLDGGLLTNNNAIVNANGIINGPISIGGQVFHVTGTLTGNNTFTLTNNAILDFGNPPVAGRSFTGITTLTNNSGAATGISIGAGDTLGANVAVNTPTTVTSANIDVAGTFNIATTLTNAGGITVRNGGTVTATTGTTNSGSIAVSGSLTTGGMTNSGTVTVLAGGTVTDVLNNSGTVTNAGTYNADVNNLTPGTITNQSGGIWNGNLLSNTGTVNNNSGATWNGSWTTAGAATNDGTVNGSVTNSGTLGNTGTITGSVTNLAGTTTTTGTISGGVTNFATFNANGGAVDGAIANNAGTFTVSNTVTSNGAFTNSAQLTVNSGANYTISGGLTNNAGGTVTNNGTLGAQVTSNTGAITNSATGTWNGGVLSSTGTITNDGKWVTGAAGFTTGAVIAGVSTGTFNNTGTLDASAGFLTNFATVNARGTILGPITNSGLFTLTGNLLGNSTFSNTTSGTLAIGSNTYSGISTLTNSGTVNLAAGGEIKATTINNNALANINFTNTAGVSTLSGTVNNSGSLNVTSSAAINGTLNNNATGVVNMFTDPAQSAAQKVLGSTTVTNYNGAAGSKVQVDIDLSRTDPGQRADRLSSTTAGGSTTISFRPVNSLGSFFPNPIPVLTTAAAGSSVNAVAENLPANIGAVNYSLQKDVGGVPGWSVVSTVNTGAITSTLTGILASLSSIDASFHQPASALVASVSGTDPNKWSGGPWVRVSGGRNDVSSTGTNVLPGGQSFSAASLITTTFEGIQAGFDSGVLNLGGSMWNVHLGVTGGEISASSQQQLGPGLLNFRVPFIGLYMVATRGNFYADVTVRRDFFNMDASNPLLFLSGQEFRGNGTNVNASTGYHVDLGKDLFFEPSAGISWTRSNFGSINLPAGVATTSTLGTLDFNTITSVLGRVGARVGTSFSVANQVVLTPFVSFSAWHEFESSATASATLSGSLIPLTTTRLGTFYQASGGISFQVPNTGFLGFVRGDYRKGENIEGFTGLGGLRYTFGPY